ncbi:MerR family transcriptional regulator [Nocardia sp. NPDC127579]|uniref:DNA polymerase III subunit beta family protein n=1 Tax=Nocardia sp. NPDC127579 TaxID=3345402 RepID=UPI00362CC320
MTELTIGAMARATGVTASALRFYDDCGLLPPARVDPVTGYRYYTEEQCGRAVALRRLREIGVPLDAVARILDGEPREAAQVLDGYVRELRQRAQAAAEIAEELKQGLAAIVIGGAALAEAVAQVRSACARDSEFPVLCGIYLEADSSTLSVTATDRYRLTTRTLVPRQGVGRWSVVADADALATVAERLRGAAAVSLSASEESLLVAADGIEYCCDAIAEPFPDYRSILGGLPEIRTRVVVDRAALLAASDRTPITLSLTESECAVPGWGRLPATVAGAPLDIAFAPEVLRPALTTAVGPEIMLDLAAPDAPVIVRSATDGDLTTVVMPIRIP